MVILDLAICSDFYLEVSRRLGLYLSRVGNLKVWRVHRLDQGFPFMILDCDCVSRTWSRFFLLNELV